MTSSKSLPSVADVLAQLPDTVSTYRDADTKRRRYSIQGTVSKHSRSNKICLVCGEVKKAESRGVMCLECYQKTRAIKVHLACTHCGKEFDRKLYEHEKALRKGRTDAFCSVVCLCAHNNEKKERAALRPCRYCGKMISRQKMGVFCSPECKIAAKPPRVLQDRICPFCGDTFSPKISRTQFCSNSCADAAHSVRMRGEGNSHFKTGTSYAKWFTEMRLLVMDRDERRCVICQQEEEISQVIWRGQTVNRTNLRVHHVNDDPTNNTPENLVTLCQKCHVVHHHSNTTPWPWLGTYAQVKSQSMTSKWKDATTSLREMYSSTTAP